MSPVCPRCDGTGEAYESVLRPNPFSGVPTVDPQCEEAGRCPACNGSGVRARREPRAERAADEMVARLAASLKDAA